MPRAGGYYSGIGTAAALPGAVGKGADFNPVVLGASVAIPVGGVSLFSTAAALTFNEDGFYLIFWQGVVYVSIGATPPTALSFGGRVDGVARAGSIFAASALLVANANFAMPISVMARDPSASFAAAAPHTLDLLATSTGAGNTATALLNSYVFYGAVRQQD